MADTAAVDVLVVTVVNAEDGVATTETTGADVSTVTGATAIAATAVDEAATGVTVEPAGTDHETGEGVTVSDGHTPHARLAVSPSASLTVSW